MGVSDGKCISGGISFQGIECYSMANVGSGEKIIIVSYANSYTYL